MPSMTVLLTASVLLFTACHAKDDPSESKDFFANSLRRDAEVAELSAIAVFDTSGCTAFFVQNTAGRTFVVSARHCANYQLTLWCTAGGKVRTVDGASEGTCSRLVAADATHDIALFEVSMTPPIAHGLLLASYYPESGTRLKMLGFPADPAAGGRPTVTENCWYLGEIPGTGQHPPGHEDRKGRHNCSTYGGNSGGPILVEGTNHVVALPSSYSPGDFNNRDPLDVDRLAYLDLVGDFTRRYAATLAAEGISTAATQISNGRPGAYLAVGLYSSTTLPQCDFYIKPLYNSAHQLSSMQVEYKPATEGACQGSETLSCNGLTCDPVGHSYQLSSLGEGGFTYTISRQAHQFNLRY